MTPRQKRMWIRRTIRAGWLLAPIGAFFVWLWEALFDDWWVLLRTIVLIIIISAIVNLFQWNSHRWAIAKPAAIHAALKDNWCMKQLIPIRQAQDYGGKPITNGQLILAETDCKKAAEDFKLVEEQKKAIAEAIK